MPGSQAPCSGYCQCLARTPVTRELFPSPDKQPLAVVRAIHQ
jgi:hypothetical protein